MKSLIVRMPRSLFKGGWTKENVEMFHRLRDWNVEPDIRSINLSMSQEQAFRCGEKDVVARLYGCPFDMESMAKRPVKRPQECFRKTFPSLGYDT